jgi:hypothetical protein
MASALPHNPLSLTGRRIPAVRPLIQIALLAALLIALNFFPECFGVIISANKPDSFIPLLGPEFRIHLPWLNAWIGLTLALRVIELWLRHEHSFLWLGELLVDLFGIGVLSRMLVSGPVIDANLGVLTANLALVQIAESALSWLALLFDLTLGLAILGLLLRCGCRVFRLLTSRSVA